MKKLIWPLAIVTCMAAGIFLGADNLAHSDIAKYEAMLAQHPRVPAQVIVKLSATGKSSLNAQFAHELLRMNHLQLAAVHAFETNRDFYTVKLADDRDMASYLEEANKNPNIAYAEPNYLYHLDAMSAVAPVVPNDPEFSQLWGLKNTGQADKDGTVGIAGADIDATKAWTISKGSKSIVVAVIDTGVDYNNPELKDNIYINPGESGDGKETNGIDDDGNGFVDDFHGWNFAGVSTNNPFDDNNHGTHVSGTIGAKGNNKLGVVGVNWNVSILPVKFLTGAGSGSLEDAVKSIQYATLMHVNVMSNSWGGGSFSQTLLDAITDAKKHGILFVAAAGNDSQDADSSPHYPASYDVDNVIAVAATNNQDALADFSTYGKKSVHIAAPGNNILSTIPNGGFDIYSGTSMATPHVSGAAALLWSTNKALTYTAIKDRLLRSRDYVPGLAKKVSTAGRLNVYNALAGIYPPAPAQPNPNAWKDLPIPAPIETDHPYKENARREWVINAPAGTKYIRVHYVKVETESKYDFVRILDVNGSEVEAISGKLVDAYSDFVAGEKAIIRFSSDSTQNAWGFQIDKAQIQ